VLLPEDSMSRAKPVSEQHEERLDPVSADLCLVSVGEVVLGEQLEEVGAIQDHKPDCAGSITDGVVVGSDRDNRSMRSTAELLELPYTFAVRELLTADDYLRGLRDRGISMSREGLEGLHRVGLVVPFLRVRRDGREIAAAFRARERDAYSIAHWQYKARRDLEELVAAERLFDPAREKFIPRSQMRRDLGEFHYDASAYLYAQQQYIFAPLIREALPSLRLTRRAKSHVAALDAHAIWKETWATRAAHLREVAIAAVALEPVFYPQLMGVLRLEWSKDADVYFRWRDGLPLERVLRWLGVDPQWLYDAGQQLISVTDWSDPLGPWSELVAHAAPSQWASLRGQALTAVDLRIAAEMLLRYHDQLVERRRARRPTPVPRRYPDPLRGRLKRRRPLDRVLTEFGLSPHPQLVLVVEGETERRTFPRVMDHFGIRRDEDFISIQDAEGVGRKLEPLVAYLAPRLGEEEPGRYVELDRPPTRLLVVVDAEGPAETEAQREETRLKWLDRLLRTMPRDWHRDEQRMALMRQQLDGLVNTTSWRKSGDRFEFSHFTDLQLVRAMDRIDTRSRRMTFEKRLELVQDARAGLKNFKLALGGVSKLDLADELWPVLEKKILRADARGRADAVPIVAVLDRALELAREYPRRGLVLSLTH
jgi:hypothetical protein